jgi:hypothetical protein
MEDYLVTAELVGFLWLVAGILKRLTTNGHEMPHSGHEKRVF